MTRARLAWIWIIALMVAVTTGCGGGDEAAPGALQDAARDNRADVPSSDTRSDTADARDAQGDGSSDARPSDAPSPDAAPDVARDARVDGGQQPDGGSDAVQPPPDSNPDGSQPPPDGDPDASQPPSDGSSDTAIPPDGGDAGFCTSDNECPPASSHCNTTTGACVSVSSIGITPVNPTIANGTNQQFQASFVYSDNSTGPATALVTWSSSDLSKATIAAGGLATAVGVGATTITATLGTVNASTTLTVTTATLSSIAVTPTNPTNPLGTTQQFEATGTFSDNTTQTLTTQVSWTSSTTSRATISNTPGSQGLATTLSVGTTTITAQLGGVSGSTLLTVTSATLVSIAVEPADQTIAAGTTLQFQATGTYTDLSTQNLTTQVTWASSNNAFATISNGAGSQGFATAIAAGPVNITATLGSVVGTTSLTVSPATLATLQVTPTNPSIPASATQQFVATGIYTDNSTQDVTTLVTWSSSQAGVATISNTSGSQGLATPVAAGTATITAALGIVSDSTTLTVNPVTLVSIAVTPTNQSIPNGTTRQYTATGSYSDGSTLDITSAVTWLSSNPAIASMSNAPGTEGLTTALTVGGPITISATLGSITGTTQLTVTAVTLSSITITPATATIARSTTLQFVAIGHYNDGSTQDLTTQANWASSVLNVATVSNAAGDEGLASGKNAGSSTISATFGGMTGTATLTVTSATLTAITVTPANATIDDGDTLQYTATGTFSDGTTQDITRLVTWHSSAAQVAKVSNAPPRRGLATATGPGDAIITAQRQGISGATGLHVN